MNLRSGRSSARTVAGVVTQPNDVMVSILSQIKPLTLYTLIRIIGVCSAWRACADKHDSFLWRALAQQHPILVAIRKWVASSGGNLGTWRELLCQATWGSSEPGCRLGNKEASRGLLPKPFISSAPPGVNNNTGVVQGAYTPDWKRSAAWGELDPSEFLIGVQVTSERGCLFYALTEINGLDPAVEMGQSAVDPEEQVIILDVRNSDTENLDQGTTQLVLGRHVRRELDGQEGPKFCIGCVESYNMQDGRYRVAYLNGIEETLDLEELKEVLLPDLSVTCTSRADYPDIAVLVFLIRKSDHKFINLTPVVQSKTSDPNYLGMKRWDQDDMVTTHFQRIEWAPVEEKHSLKIEVDVYGLEIDRIHGLECFERENHVEFDVVVDRVQVRFWYESYDEEELDMLGMTHTQGFGLPSLANFLSVLSRPTSVWL